MDNGKVSWWHTVPGVVTAIAGAITAVAGLLLTLNQVGLIGNRGAAPPSNEVGSLQSSSGSSVAAAGDTKYLVAFPKGDEATLASSRADGTYKILETRVDDKNTGQLKLTLNVRLTNTGRLDLNFWSDTFRLVIDGVPRAPTNSLNKIVNARSADEGDVVFELPASAKNLVLSLDNGQDRADLPVVLKKSS